MGLTTYALGKISEEKIVASIKQQLIANSIHPVLIQDVCYKQKGKYDQIDCVMLTTIGFYCIEIKSWSGKVYPTNDKTWLVVNKGRKPYFPNPIIQNGRHQFVLNKLCEKNVPEFLNGLNFFRSVIIFDDKTEINNSEYINVINAKDFAQHALHIDDNIDINTLIKTAEFIERLVKVNKPKFEQQQRGIIERSNASIMMERIK